MKASEMHRVTDGGTFMSAGRSEVRGQRSQQREGPADKHMDPMKRTVNHVSPHIFKHVIRCIRWERPTEWSQLVSANANVSSHLTGNGSIRGRSQDSV